LLEYPIWLIAGLLVPVSTLPIWIHPVSWLLAPTWGMEAIRGAALGSSPPYFAILACLGLAVAYYFAARVLLVVVLDKARRDATLALQ
jgi:ABC-2 type transport system permease protein